MMTTLILTLIGNDRPGMVEQIAQQVARREGRWLKSEFSGVSGQFAGYVQVEVPTAKARVLTRELQELEGPALRLLITEDGYAPSGKCYPLTLRFIGLDRHNIIAEISSVLTRHGVTISNFNSHRASAPMSGETLFKAELQVQVPLSVSCDRLCEALEALTPELIVDLEHKFAQAI